MNEPKPNVPFPTFQPQEPTQAPPLFSEAAGSSRKPRGRKPAATKPKKPRKQRQPPTPIAPADKTPVGEPRTKPKNTRQPRKARTVPKVRADKNDIGTLMDVMIGMKQADSDLFRATYNMLMAAPKAVRARVVEAIGKIFG